MRNLFFCFARTPFILGLAFLVLITTVSCSGRNSLYPLFSSYHSEKKNERELIKLPEIKERIIQEYSQPFYDKMLEMENISTGLQYDSIQEMYYCNFRKDNTEDYSGIRIRYYVDNDSLAVTLIIKRLEIDKTGESDYGDWRNFSSQSFNLIKQRAE